MVARRPYHDECAPSRKPATKPKEEGEFLLPLETAPREGTTASSSRVCQANCIESNWRAV
jgi:hypothetical protein